MVSGISYVISRYGDWYIVDQEPSVRNSQYGMVNQMDENYAPGILCSCLYSFLDTSSYTKNYTITALDIPHFEEHPPLPPTSPSPSARKSDLRVLKGSRVALMSRSVIIHELRKTKIPIVTVKHCQKSTKNY